MLEIEHLNKSFGNNRVLEDLNLELKNGSVCGLVGVNGAGKSTLLRLIAGVYQRDGGVIRLDGRDTWHDVDVRRHIAFAGDEVNTPLGSTIRSMRMLYEAMYDFDEIFFETCRKEFELDEDKPLAQFSKGMKRRTAILFALSIHPKLLLLDEVYDGLEPIARLRFKQLLAERMEEEHMTVIIASHSLRELEDICDTFAILQNRRITQSGDLLEEKSLLRKYQLAFDHEVTMDRFGGLRVLQGKLEGRVVQLVIRGEEEAVMHELRRLNPLLIDVLPVTFEELFMLEIEGKGEGHE